VKKYKIASGFAPFSPCADRFNIRGYRPPMSLEEQFKAASKINGLVGIGLDYPYQFKKPKEIKPLLEKYNLQFVTLEIGLYPDEKWKKGTYTAPDPEVRKEAIQMSKEALDVAYELGAEDVLMWPGQDGFDYPFECDYLKYWTLLVEGITEVASYRPDVKIAIEYKPKEPRTNCFVRNAGVLLSLLADIDMKNVGGCIDLGHSLAAGENAGESVVLLHRAGKLYQVHINDNFRDWDHDLIVGSVSFWETLEFFYWLRRCNWEGWYILDIYPYRIDGAEALEQAVNRTRFFVELAARIDSEGIQKGLEYADVITVGKEIWNTVFGGL